jgi:hypothetical protein
VQPPSDLHGIGHTARVMVWAAVRRAACLGLSQLFGRLLTTAFGLVLGFGKCCQANSGNLRQTWN